MPFNYYLLCTIHKALHITLDLSQIFAVFINKVTYTTILEFTADTQCVYIRLNALITTVMQNSATNYGLFHDTSYNIANITVIIDYFLRIALIR